MRSLVSDAVTRRPSISGQLVPVKVPSGSYKNAMVVESTLSQKGFSFGSGRRDSWFVPGKGLVKLVFRHRDGSVSTVERLR